VVAALKHSDRVSTISLTVTRSLVEKLSSITEPLSELEELVLLSQDNEQLSLPNFRWGSRLRRLHSTRIAFSSLPQLISPCQDLVDLQLHEIPRVGCFSPEVFANALSGMTQLGNLSLHFLSLPSRRSFLRLPPTSGERVSLPALTSLKYRGTSKYLDCLVARVDAPRLEDIDITFFGQPTMDASQLGRFIERVGTLSTLYNANIRTSEHAISIAFTDYSASTPLRLQVSCRPLNWQLSSMAQICDQFSPFLFRVEDLYIDATQPPSGQDETDGSQWLELIRPFREAKNLEVDGQQATDILFALRPVDGEQITVLPSLRVLHIQKPTAICGSVFDTVHSFITARSLSGRPVQVHGREYLCHVCDSSFTEPQRLKEHLDDKHKRARVRSKSLP